MNISKTSAMEIFTNPGDLEITIWQETWDGKFAISISRGQGQNCKSLLISQPFADKPEGAVDAVKGILEAICVGQEVSRSEVMNPDLISRIIEELRQRNHVSTCLMFAPVG